MKVIHWAFLLVGLTIATAFIPTMFADELPSRRFVVVSQQYVDSGAKVIVLKDTSQPDYGCYLIYEAGAGMLLNAKAPCK